MQIGPYYIDNPLILAPMAGVTDRPFRQLCKQLGAGMTVSEMIAANPKLWNSRKSLLRADHSGEPGIRSVQIAGADPDIMALAAAHNVENNAQLIDINMGCPAKKVCNKAAGSALLEYPKLVESILNSVVAAVDVPVTLKIRTGTDQNNINGLEIAKIAEQAGIQALAVHGRTRACAYRGEAEYDTIAAIKDAISIPVIANGDITTPEKALEVKYKTGADALMIGRAAQGQPWIFREISHFLTTGEKLAPPSLDEVAAILLQHLAGLHEFYGELMGCRIARKHVGWYLKAQSNERAFRKQFNQLEQADQQIAALNQYFQQLNHQRAIAA